MPLTNRQPDLLVPAGGQPDGVVRAGPVRAPGVHDALERDQRAVRDGAHVGRPAGVAVRKLRADGLQRGLRDQLLDIVQRRGVRAPAARHPNVRHQPVLLRRVPVRGGAVRRHGRLEAVRAAHRGAAAGQRGRPVQGERDRDRGGGRRDGVT